MTWGCQRRRGTLSWQIGAGIRTPWCAAQCPRAAHCPGRAATAAFDALTRCRFAAPPSQVAELASGANDTPATTADAVPTSPPAALLRRTSPPAPLRCQVPSCALPLDTLRIYNQRSRYGRTGVQAPARRRLVLGFCASARATARGCDAGRRLSEFAPMWHAQRHFHASKESCALMPPCGALFDSSCPASLRRPGYAWSTCERRRCC